MPRATPYIVAALACLAAPCWAGNDDEVLLGNDAALIGGAVSAITSGGDAIWYNPAGLGQSHLDSIDVTANALTLRTVKIPAFLGTTGGSTTSGSYIEVLTVPSAMTFVRRISERWVGGVAIFVPRSNDIELISILDVTQPQPRRWVLLANDVITRYHFCGSAAVRLFDGLYVGGTVSLIYEREVGTFSFAGVDEGSVDNPAFLSAAQHSVRQTFGFDLRGGLRWSLPRGWQIGLAVQAPGMVFAQRRRDSSTNAAYIPLPTGEVASTATVDDTKEWSTALEPFTPARFRIGIARLWRHWTFAVDGDWQLGLDRPSADIKRDPVWNVRLGVQRNQGEHWIFGLGLLTDRKSDRSSGAFRASFYGFSGGATYTTARRLAPQEQHDHLYFSTTLALRYAHGSGRTEGLRVPEGSISADNGFAFDPSIDFSVHEVALQIGSSLYF